MLLSYPRPSLAGIGVPRVLTGTHRNPIVAGVVLKSCVLDVVGEMCLSCTFCQMLELRILTLRTIAFDRVPFPRHAHVSYAMCSCNVNRLSWAASNGKRNHGKSHETVVAIVTKHDEHQIQDPTRTRKLSRNKAERAWKVQKQKNNIVVIKFLNKKRKAGRRTEVKKVFFTFGWRGNDLLDNCQQEEN